MLKITHIAGPASDPRSDSRSAALALNRGGKRRDVAAIGLNVPHAGTEVVVAAPVKHGDVVTSCHEALHDLAADERRAADDEDLHLRLSS